MGVKPNYISNTNAVRTERIAIGVVYNTDQVQESDLPDTWDGLVNPKWAGKVVVDPRGDQLQLLAIAWGKDKTVDFVKRLKQTDKPQVVQGATAGLLTVASGENKITTNGPAAETAEQQSKGAPVAIRYLDVVPAVDYTPRCRPVPHTPTLAPAGPRGSTATQDERQRNSTLSRPTTTCRQRQAMLGWR